MRSHRLTRSLPTSAEFLGFSYHAAFPFAAAMQPPSLEERDHYYDGLPSCPRLIARSSVTPWRGAIPPEKLRYHTKRLVNVGSHRIVEAWNDSSSTGSLRASILDTLDGIDWTAVDILRVGYADPLPVVVMVSVRPGAVSFETGSAIVRRCKQLLDRDGLGDVECEMRESTVSSLQTSPPASPSLPRLSHFPPARDTFYPDRDVSDRIGVCIASRGSPTVEGTRCLYLGVRRQDQDRESIVALTCRHVAIPASHDEGLEYRFDAKMAKRKLVQPGDTTFAKHLESVGDMVQYYSGQIVKSHDRRDTHPDTFAEDPEPRLKKLRDDRAPWQASLDRLRSMEPLSSRVFGHLLYARSYDLREDGWLSDWALVELDPDKFEQPLDALGNQILMDSLPSETTEPAYRMQPDADRGLFDKGKELSLRNILAEADIVNPPDVGIGNVSGLVVAKLGCSTNLTLGRSNEVKSVVRRPLGDGEWRSEEWCIVSINEGGRFSKPGDSGACVFDLRGRIAGMITAGNGEDAKLDITYATPMERLLRDVEASGFRARVL